MKAGSAVVGVLIVFGGSAQADLLVSPIEIEAEAARTRVYAPFANSDLRAASKDYPGLGVGGGTLGLPYSRQDAQFEFGFFMEVPNGPIINKISLHGQNQSRIEMNAGAPSEIVLISTMLSVARFEVTDPVSYSLSGALETLDAEITGSGWGNASSSVYLYYLSQPGTPVVALELTGFSQDYLDFDLTGNLFLPGEYQLILSTSVSAWSQELGSVVDGSATADATLEFFTIPTPGGLGAVLGGIGLIASRRRR